MYFSGGSPFAGLPDVGSPASAAIGMSPAGLMRAAFANTPIPFVPSRGLGTFITHPGATPSIGGSDAVTGNLDGGVIGLGNSALGMGQDAALGAQATANVSGEANIGANSTESAVGAGSPSVGTGSDGGEGGGPVGDGGGPGPDSGGSDGSGADAGGLRYGGHFLVPDSVPGPGVGGPDSTRVTFQGTPGEHVIVVPQNRMGNEIMQYGAMSPFAGLAGGMGMGRPQMMPPPMQGAPGMRGGGMPVVPLPPMEGAPLDPAALRWPAELAQLYPWLFPPPPVRGPGDIHFSGTMGGEANSSDSFGGPSGDGVAY